MFITHSFIFEVPDGHSFTEFGEEIIGLSQVVVDGCLYAPVSTSDLDFPNIRDDKTTIRIDLPKTFTDSLKNAEVVFEGTGSSLDGRRFTVVGDSGSFMVENTPGAWNRFVIVQEVSSFRGEDE